MQICPLLQFLKQALSSALGPGGPTLAGCSANAIPTATPGCRCSGQSQVHGVETG